MSEEFKMTEVILNGVRTTVTAEQFLEYTKNPKYKVVMEGSTWKILERMEG